MEENEDQIIVDEVKVEDEVVEQEAVENSDVSEENPETVQDDEVEDEEDRIVTIGEETSEEAEEEAPDEAETPLIRKVRAVNRKQEKEIKKLRKQLESQQAATEKEKPVELGEKPTLKSCKYDDKKYEEELIKYYDRKKKVEEQAAQKAKAIEAQQAEWRAKGEAYAAKKQEYAFKDFDEVEADVQDTLSQTQIGIIVEGASDSALVVYALGKNQQELDRLSKIQNPIIFAFEVAKLESKLKVTNKRAPAPEKRVSAGKSGGTATVDQNLERLEKEAERTGDRTKIRLYRKQLREKGQING